MGASFLHDFLYPALLILVTGLAGGTFFQNRRKLQSLDTKGDDRRDAIVEKLDKNYALIESIQDQQTADSDDRSAITKLLITLTQQLADHEHEASALQAQIFTRLNSIDGRLDLHDVLLTLLDTEENDDEPEDQPGRGAGAPVHARVHARARAAARGGDRDGEGDRLARLARRAREPRTGRG